MLWGASCYLDCECDSKWDGFGRDRDADVVVSLGMLKQRGRQAAKETTPES